MTRTLSEVRLCAQEIAHVSEEATIEEKVTAWKDLECHLILVLDSEWEDHPPDTLLKFCRMLLEIRKAELLLTDLSDVNFSSD